MSGTEAAKSTLGIHIHALAEGALHAMLVSQWKTAVCLVGLVATSLFGGAFAPRAIPFLTKPAAAATVFLDDFENGSATDGDPVTWRGIVQWPTSVFSVADGNLYVTSSQLGAPAVIGVPDKNLRDSSIRAQVRLEGADVAAVSVRGHEQDGHAYNLEVAADGGVWVGLAGEWTRVQTGLRPTDEDVVLQLDAIGDAIEARAWRASESMPEAPLLISVTTRHPTGFPGVYYAPPFQGMNGRAVFRYVHVADSAIVPEPTTNALAGIGGGLLLVGAVARIRRSGFPA